MRDKNQSKTPAEKNLKLIKATEDEQIFERTQYIILLWSLQYIAKQTKPDIFWDVNVLSRFMDKQKVFWHTRSPLYISHKVSQTCVNNSIQLGKVMQTGVETMMTEDQPLIVFSNWDSVGEQWVGKARSRRQWLSPFAKRNIRVWLMHFKKQQSCDHYWVNWAISRCKQRSLVRAIKAATNWLTTLCCKSDQNISTPNTISYERKSMTVQFNFCTRQLINWQPICWQRHFHKSKLSNIDKNDWVKCRFFLRLTEKSAWWCWGIQLRIPCATKFKVFFHNSSKSRRNKLTWCDSKLYVVQFPIWSKVLLLVESLFRFNLRQQTYRICPKNHYC